MNKAGHHNTEKVCSSLKLIIDLITVIALAAIILLLLIYYGV